MTGRRDSASQTPRRPTRRQSVPRATPADGEARGSAPPPTVTRDPASRPPRARAASATPRAPPSSTRPTPTGAAAPRVSVGGIRRDLRAAVGGTPLRPAAHSADSATRPAHVGPRASRLSIDTTLGDIFPPLGPHEADAFTGRDAGANQSALTPRRTPAARTPGMARTPLTRSAIRRASESRRPLARRSTLGAGVARVESPFDLLWRLAHPRPVPDMSLLETTVEQPGLETELDTTAGDTLAPAGENMLHPGPSVPGDLTDAVMPRLSASQRSQRGESEPQDDEDEDWAAELDQLNLPSPTQARAALDRVLASTPRRAAGDTEDEEAERERDRLAEEELTRLLAVDPNDFTTMSAALARRLSTHARLGGDLSRTSGRRTPTLRPELGSELDESPGGAITPARSEVTADETEIARRAAPARTSLGASLAGQPDEADLYGLGEEMPPLEDAPFFEEGEEPSFPYPREEASLTRDQPGAATASGEITTGEADATAASATRMLNLSAAEAELLEEEQPGSPPVEAQEPEPEDVGLLDVEAGAESDGSWASDQSVGGVLRQRLARRTASGRSTRRERDRVPATLVTRLFSAVAGSNYRLDPAALTAVQDASDAFFGALARDVSAAARARLRRPRDQPTTRATTITETDLLAALVAHGHVDARHDVYTTALTLLPRELSDWIDVARVEPQRAAVRRATQAARATNQAASQAVETRPDEADETGAVRAPGLGDEPRPKPSQARAKAAGKRPAAAAARRPGASKRPRGVPANPLASSSRPRAKPANAGRR